MNRFVIILYICDALAFTAQIPPESIFSKLKESDSVIIYQGLVEQGVQLLVTASGQTVSGTQKPVTVVEKYVLKKNPAGWGYERYVTSLCVFPNRKFSGLKIKERPYWNFKRQDTGVLSPRQIELLIRLEALARETTEYDFALTRHTTNQIILKNSRRFRQLVLDKNYRISDLLKL